MIQTNVQDTSQTYFVVKQFQEFPKQRHLSIIILNFIKTLVTAGAVTASDCLSIGFEEMRYEADALNLLIDLGAVSDVGNLNICLRCSNYLLHEKKYDSCFDF